MTKTTKKSDSKPSDSWLYLPDTDEKEQVFIQPVLRLNLYVVGKLEFLLRHSHNEVGGFFVAGNPNDLLAITDFVLVKQRVTPISVDFDDEGLHDFLVDMAMQGLETQQFRCIWAHTHPDISANPSLTDEDTFAKKFNNRALRGKGCCHPWSGMFIKSKRNEHYFRIQFNPEFGPSASLLCPVVLDPTIPFRKEADSNDWLKEYESLVTEERRSTWTRTSVYSKPSYLQSTTSSSVASFPGHSSVGEAYEEDLFDRTEDPRLMSQDALDDLSPQELDALMKSNPDLFSEDDVPRHRRSHVHWNDQIDPDTFEPQSQGDSDGN